MLSVIMLCVCRGAADRVPSPLVWSWCQWQTIHSQHSQISQYCQHYQPIHKARKIGLYPTVYQK
jgi:hypothetical protein